MEVRDSELSVLIEFLKREHGIDFSNYAKSSLRRRIVRILQLMKLESCNSIILKIKKDPHYLTEFVEEVTVNTTELFRDPEFWIYLRDQLVPKIQDYQTIRIWHAGCSSGEEVFSLSILLEEAGLAGKAKIVATDINESVIERAKMGRYSATNNLAGMQENYSVFNPDGDFRKYATVNGKFVQLRKSLLDNVEFRKHDLVRGAAFAKVNLILCRNVLIYFDQELQNKVLRLFYDSLVKDGYLGIGSKETLMLGIDHEEFHVFDEKHRVYKRQD